MSWNFQITDMATTHFLRLFNYPAANKAPIKAATHLPADDYAGRCVLYFVKIKSSLTVSCSAVQQADNPQ